MFRLATPYLKDIDGNVDIFEITLTPKSAKYITTGELNVVVAHILDCDPYIERYVLTFQECCEGVMLLAHIEPQVTMEYARSILDKISFEVGLYAPN